MGEERKEWFEQFNRNFGVREILRFGCAIVIWIILGAALGVAFEIAGYSAGGYIFVFFLLMLFMFPPLAYGWKPTYRLFRIILANENLPIQPPPRSTIKTVRPPLPRWYYLLVIWRWILGLLVLYFMTRYFFLNAVLK